eukprot:5594043-Prymnesium_polylepis.1
MWLSVSLVSAASAGRCADGGSPTKSARPIGCPTCEAATNLVTGAWMTLEHSDACQAAAPGPGRSGRGGARPRARP